MAEPTNQFAEISRLLTDYQRFNERFERERIVADTLAFGQLLTGWRALKQASDAYERQVATGYNVFGIYENFFKDERRLHSPFLADLLNVNGAHRQGDLFYREFLRLVVGPEAEAEFSPADPFYFSVVTEHWTGDGYIDILIRYRDANRSFAIAIENKIYAGDQERQLERYYDYLSTLGLTSSCLIYLTPSGRSPDPAGNTITPDRHQKLVEEIKLASYHTTIAGV